MKMLKKYKKSGVRVLPKTKRHVNMKNVCRTAAMWPTSQCSQVKIVLADSSTTSVQMARLPWANKNCSQQEQYQITSCTVFVATVRVPPACATKNSYNGSNDDAASPSDGLRNGKHQCYCILYVLCNSAFMEWSTISHRIF